MKSDCVQEDLGQLRIGQKEMRAYASHSHERCLGIVCFARPNI